MNKESIWYQIEKQVFIVYTVQFQLKLKLWILHRAHDENMQINTKICSLNKSQRKHEKLRKHIGKISKIRKLIAQIDWFIATAIETDFNTISMKLTEK